MRVDKLSIKLVSLNKETKTKTIKREGEGEKDRKQSFSVLTAATTNCITSLLFLLPSST